MTQAALIFDLDGTLVDTEPAAARAVEECFSEWKLPIHHDDAYYITGRTWAKAIEFLYSKYPIPVTVPEAARMMSDRYHAHLKEHLTIVPGSAEAVRDLAKEYPLALVSGSSRAEILFALEYLGITSQFRFYLGCEDYLNSKPAPDGYLKAIDRLGVSPKNCLVFEDSEAGIRSAISAGTWVVAIDATNHSGQDTSSAHAKVPDLLGVNRQWVGDFFRRQV